MRKPIEPPTPRPIAALLGIVCGAGCASILGADFDRPTESSVDAGERDASTSEACLGDPALDPVECGGDLACADGGCSVECRPDYEPCAGGCCRKGSPAQSDGSAVDGDPPAPDSGPAGCSPPCATAPASCAPRCGSACATGVRDRGGRSAADGSPPSPASRSRRSRPPRAWAGDLSRRSGRRSSARCRRPWRPARSPDPARSACSPRTGPPGGPTSWS